MLEQLKIEAGRLWAKVRPAMAEAVRYAQGGLRALWAALRPPLVFTLQVIAALAVLFEEWGWRPLSEALARLARFRPWAAVEAWIAGLPPYAALGVFAVPVTALFPLKFVAVWLLARGLVWPATALFLGAKVVSTALIARIFLLTKPSLMQIPWFARTYFWFTAWKEELYAVIRQSFVWRYGRMLKTRTRLALTRAWQRLKPQIDDAVAEVRPWFDDSVNAVKTATARTRRNLKFEFGLLASRIRLALSRLAPRLQLEAARLGITLRRSWQRIIGSSF